MLTPKRAPWVLTPAEAAAREDAIYERFLADVKRSQVRFVRDDHAERWLKQQYENAAVRTAIMASLMRRSAAL